MKPGNMGRRFAITGVAALFLSVPANALKVCADPDFLPYSNRAEEGFENKVAEAVAKLDRAKYELVLSGDDDSCRHVLAYARVKDYRPATGMITSYAPEPKRPVARSTYEISIHTENVPHLLGKVADLIGLRAIRRYRPARQAV